jgi:hypothetical protein
VAQLIDDRKQEVDELETEDAVSIRGSCRIKYRGITTALSR